MHSICICICTHISSRASGMHAHIRSARIGCASPASVRVHTPTHRMRPCACVRILARDRGVVRSARVYPVCVVCDGECVLAWIAVYAHAYAYAHTYHLCGRASEHARKYATAQVRPRAYTCRHAAAAPGRANAHASLFIRSCMPARCMQAYLHTRTPHSGVHAYLRAHHAHGRAHLRAFPPAQIHP
jgi:hypothetical protein